MSDLNGHGGHARPISVVSKKLIHCLLLGMSTFMSAKSPFMADETGFKNVPTIPFRLLTSTPTGIHTKNASTHFEVSGDVT